MAREYMGSFNASGLSPKNNCEKSLEDLKTVGLKLNHNEVVELANLLNKALLNKSDWDYLNVTGFRENNTVTVTYYKKK